MPELDVLPNRERIEQLHALEGATKPESCSTLRADGRDVPAIEQHPARRGWVHSTAGIERRGLPGTVRADQTGDRAAGSSEGRVVHRLQPAERNGEALDDETGGELGHATPPRSARVDRLSGASRCGWRTAASASACAAVRMRAVMPLASFDRTQTAMAPTPNATGW